MSSTEIGRRGLLLVLSSPSGAGKTTITRLLVEREPRARHVHLRHHAQAAGGRDRWQRTIISSAPSASTEMIAKDELLEHATVFGHRYGTPRAPVEAALAAGRDIVSDIDWQGTQQLKQTVRDDLVAVFILPPSTAALEERLRRRAQDSDEVVAQRMAKSADEMSHWPEYDYVIVNHDLEASVGQVQAILTAERLRRERQVGLAEFVNHLRRGR